MKGACSIPKKKLIQLFIIIPIAALALLYGSGYLSQLFSNYRAWQEAGAVFGTSPAFPDAGFVPCLAAAFHFPYGLYGLGLCIGALALLILMVMRMGYSEGGEYDRRRNLVYSNKGTYGTAGFMSRKELAGCLILFRIFASIPVRFSESWIIRSFVFLQRLDLTGILRFTAPAAPRRQEPFAST